MASRQQLARAFAARGKTKRKPSPYNARYYVDQGQQVEDAANAQSYTATHKVTQADAIARARRENVKRDKRAAKKIIRKINPFD